MQTLFSNYKKTIVLISIILIIALCFIILLFGKEFLPTDNNIVSEEETQIGTQNGWIVSENYVAEEKEQEVKVFNAEDKYPDMLANGEILVNSNKAETFNENDNVIIKLEVEKAGSKGSAVIGYYLNEEQHEIKDLQLKEGLNTFELTIPEVGNYNFYVKNISSDTFYISYLI